MSNTVAWRAKPRTPKPNSRQKRNGLFLDANPICTSCRTNDATEAHHDLPHGHLDRNDPVHMRALCRCCHVAHHDAERLNLLRDAG